MARLATVLIVAGILTFGISWSITTGEEGHGTYIPGVGEIGRPLGPLWKGKLLGMGVGLAAIALGAYLASKKSTIKP